ncbi:MAG: isopeptide-forming domain-containing fimbrial protein [Lentihominibacter sp.]
MTALGAFAWVMTEKSSAAVDPSLLTSLQEYPGVKKFDYSAEPVRENVSPDVMVNPEYAITFNKTEPDEYFGASTVTTTNSVTGETVTGLRPSQGCVKGECGCIYRNMFRYRGMDIDVRTTYMDWNIQASRTCFIAGGFASYRWRNMWRVEMKHEFFKAGTETPVQVKGFLTYNDLDNSQGMCFADSEADDIWVNSGGTRIGYKSFSKGQEVRQNDSISWTASYDMVCIQAMTNEDIPSNVNDPDYSPELAAETDFSLTFSTDVLHTSLIDDDTSGLNILQVSSVKKIPSAFPGDSSTCVSKTVSDDNSSEAASNKVRSWEDWIYRIRVNVPPETEAGNRYDYFAITDDIYEGSKIEETKILCDGSDAGDRFRIAVNGNRVTAAAVDTDTGEFYGHEYCLEIRVSMKYSRDEALGAGLLGTNYDLTVKNIAAAEYEDGNGKTDAASNETETEVLYEKAADIIITKKVKAKDLYPDHGRAVFLFNVSGETITGEKKEYNLQIAIDGGTEEDISSGGSEYVTGTATVKGVPEGIYTCSEYDVLRFEPESITGISQGERKGDTVVFTIDSNENCRATFTNRKKFWGDYSHTGLAVNRIGLK